MRAKASRAGPQRELGWFEFTRQVQAIKRTEAPDDLTGAVSLFASDDAAFITGQPLTETFETPRLLRELGFSYVLDWCNDDQPYPLAVEGMISVPYAVMLNDISVFVTGSHTGGAYVQMLCDHLDQLLAESESSGRVMALAIHPFVINQPSLHRYLAQPWRRFRRASECGSPRATQSASTTQPPSMPASWPARP